MSLGDKSFGHYQVSNDKYRTVINHESIRNGSRMEMMTRQKQGKHDDTRHKEQEKQETNNSSCGFSNKVKPCIL